MDQNMEQAAVCKSCGMPMQKDEDFGTNADGSKNIDYCIYCCKDGKMAVFCQSCGMPMQKDEDFGANADGSKNKDYCTYCYKDGKFPQECTMEEMIDFCIEQCKEMYDNPEEAKKQMLAWFPTLKRWSSAK